MVDQVVVGATRKRLVLTIVDENDVPIDLTGATQPPRLQGKCAELPAIPLDVVGSLTDAANGVATWTALGSLVSAANLASVDPDLLSALFNLRVKFWDSAGLIDWTDEFQIAWIDDPL